jgi:hypothetical protein
LVLIRPTARQLTVVQDTAGNPVLI